MKKKLLLILMAVLAAIPSMDAVKIYVDVSQCGNLTKDNAAINIHAWNGSNGITNWPGTRMTSEGSGLYSYTTSSTITGFKIVRMNPNNTTSTSGIWNDGCSDFNGTIVDNGIYKVSEYDWSWTISYTGNTQGSTEPKVITYYLIGDIDNGWQGRNYAFTKNSDTSYSLTINSSNKLGVGKNFKILTSEGNYYIANSGAIPYQEADVSYNITGDAGDNWNFAEKDFEGTITLTVNATTGAPTKIVFHRTNYVAPTPAVTYTVYLDLSKNGGKISTPPYVYCYDSNNTGDNNASWPGVAMTAEGSLWKYSFTNSKWTTLVFSKGGSNANEAQTVDLPIVDGKTYVIDSTTDSQGKYPEYSEPAPVSEYIYFNATNDYYTKNFPDGVPFIFFNGESGDKGGHAMEKVEEVFDWIPLFRYKVPAGKTSIYRISTINNDNGYAGNNDGHYIPTYYDSKNWTSFIYNADYNGVDLILSQSYMTYEDLVQYYKERHHRPLNLIGINGNWQPQNASHYTQIQADEGVFIENVAELGFDGSKTASSDDYKYRKFKMSYIHPINDTNSAFYSYDSGTHEKRMWATFNLGLIAPALRYYTSASDRNGTPYESIDSGDNNSIKVGINKTVAYNHYNTSDWVIDSGSSNLNSVYLLVDQGEGCSTTVLLDFDPQPSVDLNLGSYDIHDLDKVSSSTKIEDAVVPGSDDSGNNVATFRFVNAVSAGGSLQTASPKASFFQSYNVEYAMTFDNESIGTIKDTTGEDRSIEVKTMLPQEGENTLASRAYYTDKTRYSEEGKQLKFRSRTAKMTGDFSVSHDAPEKAPEVKYFQLYDTDSEDGYLDALVGISFELPHRFVTDENFNDISDKAIYPSYEVWVEDVNTGARYDAQVVPTTSTYARKNTEFMTGKGSNDGYTFPNAETTGEGSWAYQAMNTSTDMTKGYLPLYVPSVARSSSSYKLKVHAKIFAVYPYRLFSEGNIEATVGASLNAPKRREGGIADNTNSAIYTYNEESPEFVTTTAYTNGDGSTSGIEGVMIEAVEGELYNLQGVRVLDEAPAPGIYIRRAADGTASKVVIK